MDISAASLSALSHGRIAGEVSVRVARAALDAQESQGEQMVSQLRGAAEFAARGGERARTGLGDMLDVEA
ncbi:MAG: YjfB family protein [Phycisphaerales bacterium]